MNGATFMLLLLGLAIFYLAATKRLDNVVKAMTS